MPSVPVPVYFHETASGYVWQHGAQIGLTLSPAAPPAEVTILAEGELVLRYGIEVQRTPDAIIPGLFIAESGATKTGREAWDWLWHKFQLYPRAEVIGLRSDGAPAHLYVRDLDFGYPPRVLVYAETEATVPLASLTTLLTPENAPELLRKYLGQSAG